MIVFLFKKNIFIFCGVRDVDGKYKFLKKNKYQSAEWEKLVEQNAANNFINKTFIIRTIKRLGNTAESIAIKPAARNRVIHVSTSWKLRHLILLKVFCTSWHLYYGNTYSNQRCPREHHVNHQLTLSCTSLVNNQIK